jgi:hypothetical protein
MKKVALGGAAFLSFALASSASATSLVADGITYTLTENSISLDGLTAAFTLTISGENTASDTEGGTSAGRTGIQALAFNNPSPGTAISGTMTSPTGFTFKFGGLNSNGCNLKGNFFCFNNTAIPPTPTTDLSGLLTFNFNVTADQTNLWGTYAPAFKIDWVGTANNYDLVSLPIPVNNEPGPNPFGFTPEPATWAMMLVGFAFVGAAMRRRNRFQAVRLTYA